MSSASAAGARDIVTASVALCPTRTVSGVIAADWIRSGFTVTVADFATPFNVAVMVTVRGAGASVVTTENGALFPFTFTELETCADGSLELSATVIPAADAENTTSHAVIAGRFPPEPRDREIDLCVIAALSSNDVHAASAHDGAVLVDHVGAGGQVEERAAHRQ